MRAFFFKCCAKIQRLICERKTIMKIDFSIKKYLFILICLIGFIPTINAATNNDVSQTKVLDLKDTVEDIDLEFKGTNYKEADDQVVVYLFRMEDCTHCHDAIKFFNDIVEEYGDKFKMRSFEISKVSANNELYKKVYEYLKIKEGVPLILIGESVFRGFKEDTKDKIKTAIEKNYENKITYDIFDAMERSQEEKKKPASIIIFAFIGLILIIIILIFAKKE